MKYLYIIAAVIMTFFVFSSTAHADTWDTVTPSGTNGVTFNSIVSILDYTYVATDNGIYLSSNHADTWTQINTGLGNTDVRTIAIGWVYDFDARGFLGGYVYNPDTLVFAATADGIYVSTIGSTTWTLSSTGLTDTNVYDIEFDSYETGDGFLTTLTIYASTPSGVFRSDDNGANWSLQNSGMAGESVKKIATNWLNGTIFAMTNTNKVYTSTLYSFSGYTTNESWVLEFESAGTTTQDINLLDMNGGIMWLATNNGILKSADTGTNWQATNIGLGSSTVNAISSDHNDSNITYAALEQGGVYRTTNEALGTPQWLPINTGLTSYNIKDVQTNGATFTYVYAVSSTTVFRLNVTSSTPYPDMTPPEDISDLTASTTSMTAIDIDWSASGDDLSYGTATSYDVRYSTSTIAESNWVSASTATGTTSPQITGTSENMSISGLSTGTTYYFGIKVIDEVGNTSTLSNIVSATTNTLPTTPPTVEILSPVDGATTTIGTLVSITASSTDNVGVTGVQFKRDGINIGAEDTTAPFAISWDTTGRSARAYTIVAVARDNESTLATSTSITFSLETPPADVSIPTTPTTLTGTSTIATQINLTWTASTDNIAVTGYSILRATSTNPFEQIATSSATTYTDTSLTPLTEYFYALTAYDAAGNISATTSTSTTFTIASTPSNLSATSISTSQINLSWTLSTEAISGYHLYRGGTLVSSPLSTVTSFSDTGLSASTAYTYELKAHDLHGYQSVAATAGATTQAVIVSSGGGGGGGGGYVTPASTPPTNIVANASSTQILFTWTNPSSSYYRIKIIRNEDHIPTNSIDGALLYEGTDEQFLDTDIQANTTYYYAFFSLNTALSASTLETLEITIDEQNTAEIIVTTNTNSPEIPNIPNTISTYTTQTPIYTFNFSLSPGEAREEVRELQIALNALGYTISTTGAGSPGNESAYFGTKTILALQAFQRDNNVVSSGSPETTGYGNFGPSTRAVLNAAYTASTPTTSTGTLEESLIAQIAELTKLVESLTKQLTAILGNTVQNQAVYTFQRVLNVGDVNTDVKVLQQKLNTLGFTVSTNGAGSPGNESTYFGPRTTIAIKAFQCAQNIICTGSPETTGYGNFGPKTRLIMNSL